MNEDLFGRLAHIPCTRVYNYLYTSRTWVFSHAMIGQHIRDLILDVEVLYCFISYLDAATPHAASHKPRHTLRD